MLDLRPTSAFMTPLPSYQVPSAQEQCTPYRDLLFIRGMREFQRVDSGIASRVLQSLTGQTWYLDQPWMVTALVGPDVPAEEKEAVARSLVATPRPSSFPLSV